MTKPARIPGNAVDTSRRIDEIYDVMSMGLWVPGKSVKIYAKKWKIPPSTVMNYSAEAWRRVQVFSNSSEKIQPEVTAILYEGLQRARTAYKFDSLAKLADVLTKVTGARAAEKHEHAVIVAQYDALDKSGKIGYFREVIREAEEAIAAIEAEENTIEVEGEQ